MLLRSFAVGSAGLMRQALSLAINHAQTRTAFARPMSELPMQRNVLADLTARGAYTQAGATQPGMDFWQTSQGAPLGWYGMEGPNTYGAIEYGGTGGFGDVLAGRQGAINGWVNQQQAQQQTNNAAQQVLGAAFTGGGYDPNWGWQDLAQRQAAGEDISAFLPAIYQGGFAAGPVQADGGA